MDRIEQLATNEIMEELTKWIDELLGQNNVEAKVQDRIATLRTSEEMKRIFASGYYPVLQYDHKRYTTRCSFKGKDLKTTIPFLKRLAQCGWRRPKHEKMTVTANSVYWYFCKGEERVAFEMFIEGKDFCRIEKIGQVIYQHAKYMVICPDGSEKLVESQNGQE